MCLWQGHPGEATRHLEEALARYRELRNPSGEADALNSLGQACLADGDPDEARSHWQQALALFTELGVPEAGQVRAQLAAAGDDSQG